MTDNQNDEFLDTGDLDAESGLEDFETGRMSLAEAWKTNPMVKIGGILGAVAIIVGGIILFGGKSAPVSPSVMAGRGQEVKQAPGEKVSDTYREALEEVNQKTAEDAARTGESALPVPIGAPRGKVVEDAAKESEEDPLERWRRIQEERLKKEQQVKVDAAAQPQPRPVDPYAQDKNALAQSMQAQMQSILELIGPKAPQHLTIASGDFLEQQRAQEERELQEQAAAAAAATGADQGKVEILLEAGRIEYAQLITEANSDVPGPILAELASGPLAGSRMIGTFSTQEEHLTLNFDTIVIDGVAVSTQAVALDPNTALPGVITDIDRKYFRRVILPAAAAFVEGLGSAIAESESTTVTVDDGAAVEESSNLDARQEFFKGVEEAAGQVSDVLSDEGSKIQPRLRVAAGTHLGLLFVKPVEKRDAVAQRIKDEEDRRQQNNLVQAPQFLFQLPQQGQGLTPVQLPATLTGALPAGQTAPAGTTEQ